MRLTPSGLKWATAADLGELRKADEWLGEAARLGVKPQHPNAAAVWRLGEQAEAALGSLKSLSSEPERLPAGPFRNVAMMKIRGQAVRWRHLLQTDTVGEVANAHPTPVEVDQMGKSLKAGVEGHPRRGVHPDGFRLLGVSAVPTAR